MALRLGIVRRHDLLVGAFGHIDQGASLVLPVVRKFVACLDPVLSEISPERFDRLYRRLKLHLSWLKDRVRQQHILNCLNSGELGELPHSFRELYFEKLDSLSRPADCEAFRRSVVSELAQEIRGQGRATESIQLQYDLVTLAGRLESIKPTLSAVGGKLCERLVTELGRLREVLEANGVGHDRIDLKALRKEHREPVFTELLEATAIAQASRPAPPANPSLVGVVRELHRFLVGQSTKPNFVAILRERLGAAESLLEARVLVRFAKRAARLYPSDERSKFVNAALEVAARRIKAKGVRLAAAIFGDCGKTRDVLRTVPRLLRSLGRRTTLAVLKANPALSAMSAESIDSYASAVKEFRCGLPEEIADRFAVSARPGIYASVDSLKAGAEEAKQLLRGGGFDSVLYRLGIQELGDSLMRLGVPAGELAAGVIGVLSSASGALRAKEVRDAINKAGVSVADVSGVLQDLCVRGWVTRDKSLYSLGKFPESRMGASIVAAFEKINGRFKPLSQEEATVRRPVSSIDEVVKEAREFIEELQAFKRIAVTDIVDRFEKIWPGLAKRTAPSSDQITLLWPPGDYARVLPVRQLLSKPGAFRTSLKTCIRTDLNVFREAGTVWKELLKLHAQVFCQHFVDAMNSDEYRQELSRYSSNIDYVIAALNLVITAAIDHTYTDLEKLKRHRPLFSKQADFDELVALVGGRVNGRES